jgi:two-component sensor histidine kinase
MDLSQSIPLGQIVNELLSNAFKHAFNDTRNGELQVTLKAEGGDRARLVVRDNGPGWHPEAEDNEPRGLGTQLIQLLSEQIGAELKYGSPPGGRIELTIPVLADENTEQISSATA